LIAYFIGNISAKKYQNPFMRVKVKPIARQRWDDFFETRCIPFSIPVLCLLGLLPNTKFKL